MTSLSSLVPLCYTEAPIKDNIFQKHVQTLLLYKLSTSIMVIRVVIVLFIRKGSLNHH